MLIEKALAGLALFAVACAADSAMAACKLNPIGEIPVVMHGQQPLVETTINGQKARLMFDTGAFFSTINSDTAARIGLEGKTEERVTLYGVGGRGSIARATSQDFQMGSFKASGVQFFITPGKSEEGGDEGVLGINLISRADVEFDLAHGVIRLFLPEGCERDVMAYWAEAAAGVELEPDRLRDNEFVVPVQVNGRKILAELDTGASTTVLDRSAARFIDMDQDAPGATSTGVSYGFGPKTLQTWSAPFQTFSIGQETIQKSRMRVADLDRNTPTEKPTGSIIGQKVYGFPEMLLGADFFRAHRIFISRGQKRMYFTYAGGPIFKLTDDTKPQAAASAPGEPK